MQNAPHASANQKHICKFEVRVIHCLKNGPNPFDYLFVT